MSRLSKLSAALAATSAFVLSASAANATVAVAIPKPTINVVVPRPAVPAVTSTITGVSSRLGTFAGKPATLQTTLSKWQGPAGAGTQDTTLIYRNGKVVGAISSIAEYPATHAPNPGNTNTTPAPAPAANNHPATSTPPQTAASHPAAPAPAPAPAAKPKTTYTPTDFPAFTDQNGRVIGYYVNGKLVMGMTGPTGGSCSPVLAYQSGGSLSSNYSSGSVQVHAVQCYVKS